MKKVLGLVLLLIFYYAHFVVGYHSYKSTFFFLDAKYYITFLCKNVDFVLKQKVMNNI